MELNFKISRIQRVIYFFIRVLFYIELILDEINCSEPISVNKYIYFYFFLYFKDFFEVLSLRICLRVWPTLFIADVAINDIVIGVNTPWLRSNIIIGYCRSICYFTHFFARPISGFVVFFFIVTRGNEMHWKVIIDMYAR